MQLFDNLVCRGGACALALASLSSSLSAAPAETEAVWSQFRGSEGRSIAKEQTLPEAFGPDQNVQWKIPMAGGHSSPIVWGGLIFLTAHEDADLQMICLRRSDGRVLWKKTRTLRTLQEYSHVDSSPAAPTPCCDGEKVAFLFGDYGLIVTDLDGNLLWEKEFIPASSIFGYGASPTSADGKLLINCDGGIRSGLLCLDFNTGKELWFAERPKRMMGYTSPYVWKQGDHHEVLLGGSSQLWSYDLSNGEALWHVDNLPGFVCTTPVAGDDAVYFGAWTTGHTSGSSMVASLFGDEVNLSRKQASDVEAFFERFDLNRDNKISKEELPPSRALDAFSFVDRDQSSHWERKEIAPMFDPVDRSKMKGRNVLVAIKGGGRGNITKTHVLWETKKSLPYVASPLLYRDRLYYVKKGGWLSCVNPETGDPYFATKRLGVSGEYYASPVAVNDWIILGSDSGILSIVKAADDFEIVHSADFEEAILASPVVVDHHIYLRTEKHLWSFGE